jgi:hypothetical protein
MAEKGTPGLLAILGAGEKGAGDDDGEPKSDKARALKAMFEACKKGDWDSAAEEFSTAYDLCMLGGDDDSDDEEPAEDEEV